MTPQEILDIEVSLLLCKYGRASVLRSLGQRLGISPQDIEDHLRDLMEKNEISEKKNKKREVRPLSLDSLIKGREEKGDSLRQLNARFHNRTFLPELKDVKRFFDRHRRQVPAIKSRAHAEKQLFNLLADLDLSTLRKLLAESPSKEPFSSLGIISDEILKRDDRKEK